MSVTRRRFVAGAGALAAGAAAASVLPGRAGATSYRAQVVVLGGGVGGLTTAHELAERGFQVTVVEPKALGGKARSIPVAGSGRGGRADLPGEHGFRFFPGFYKNVPDTMSRIPFAGNSNGVLGNLVDAHQELLTFADGQQAYVFPTSPTPTGFLECVESLLTAVSIAAGIPARETAYVVRKMLVFLTSSDARRFGEWEYVSWWDYVNAGKFSKRYQEVWGTGITKDLVAAKGHKASARTVALMGEAFVYALLGQGTPGIRQQSGYGAADRLLDAPTNEAWIDPWLAHLRSLGVTFLTGYRASRLNVGGGRITSVSLAPTAAGRSSSTIVADHVVCAMPVEKMVPLLSTAVLAADPKLAALRRLETDWMNGIQFFLNRPLGVPVKGHGAFLQTPWALTSIEQGLFWKRDIAAQYGDGSVRDILSVDISDFFTPGVVYGRPASECTPQQIATETWTQLKRALNVPGLTSLTDDMLENWFLDPAITPGSPGNPGSNSEPLLINTTGSLDWRPGSTTRIPNLFLAADYVRVNVDLATMEGANEAGRQAANAILEASGSTETPATIGTLWQPKELDLVRATDAELYKRGLPNALDIVKI